jgi:hypothetical protein
MTVMAIPNFERFFREAASIEVDKNDLKRYSDFVNTKLYDLLLMGQVAAKANGRDIIEPWDLPITKGLQECIHRYDKMEEDIELQPVLAQLAQLPQLDLDSSEETRERLPGLAGGISFALAQSFKIIDTKLKNPSTEHWERAFQLFHLLL